jgi:hypothetical protein
MRCSLRFVLSLRSRMLSNKGMKLTKPGGGKVGAGASQLIPSVGRTAEYATMANRRPRTAAALSQA